MFGLFRKSKPKTVMDTFIELVYGPNPPAKSADLRRAIALAETDLLGKRVELGEIERLARELDAGPMPYSTHDLAVAVAQNFYMKTNPSEVMRQPAERARDIVYSQWGHNGLVVPMLAKTFLEQVNKYLAHLISTEEPDQPPMPSSVLTSSDFTDTQLQYFIVQKVKHSPDFELVRSWLSGDLDRNANAIAGICIKKIRAACDARGLSEQLGVVTDAWSNELEPFLDRLRESPSPKVLDACVQIVSQMLIYHAVIDELYQNSNMLKG